ncbi:MAG TPA: DUF4412 domain-containing protein [Thermoanaerobaculia bacterium]|jgi:hypothetical protein|nr:DUF4412 domain-containing protein [Thermoanaerobaculia bacterium]
MKRVALSLVAILAASAALAQSEGVADYKITGGSGMTGTSRLYFSKAAFRIEWNMALSGDESKRERGPREMKMTMFAKLSDPDVVYSINDDTKTWSTWNTKEARDEAAKSREKYTVEKLGTDTVAGFSCQNARVKSSSGTEMEVCVTRDISAPAGWLSAMNRQRGGGAWWSAMHDAGIEGLPVRWSTKREGRGGHGGTVTMEITKFEKKSVPASMFEIPAGYTKSDPMSVGMSPEQKRQMDEALKNMTPEQRKQYEEMMKKHAQPAPKE